MIYLLAKPAERAFFAMPNTAAPAASRVSLIIPLGPGEPENPPVSHWVEQARQAGIRCLVSAVNPADWRSAPDLEWVLGPAGRGQQMNRAAARAEGSEWLWFLHADSRPCPRVLPAVLTLCRSSDECLGWFRLAYATDGPRLTRLNAVAANLRSRWLKLPYGDQGLILPRRWFMRLGGFHEALVRGEDLDLVVRAQRAGLELRALDGYVTTSARRYADQGWLKTTWRHQLSAWRLVREARRS